MNRLRRYSIVLAVLFVLVGLSIGAHATGYQYNESLVTVDMSGVAGYFKTVDMSGVAGYFKQVDFYRILTSPTSYAFGVMKANTAYSTGLTYFSTKNNGTVVSGILISGTDMVGGVTWVLGDNPGADTYALRAGLSGVSYNITVNKTPTTLVSGLVAGATQQWGLQLKSPTSYSDHTAKSGSVILDLVSY